MWSVAEGVKIEFNFLYFRSQLPILEQPGLFRPHFFVRKMSETTDPAFFNQIIHIDPRQRLSRMSFLITF